MGLALYQILPALGTVFLWSRVIWATSKKEEGEGESIQ
jgi:hypothetical protein